MRSKCIILERCSTGLSSIPAVIAEILSSSSLAKLFGIYYGGSDQGMGSRYRENAIFTSPPELAYGATGSPPTIPPNVKDICKDGGLFKKILIEGEKWENPKDRDEVLVKYEARLEDGTVVVSKSDGVEFTVKDGFFCPAISKAV